MTTLWTPATYNYQGQLTLPTGDIALAPGITLVYQGQLNIVPPPDYHPASAWQAKGKSRLRVLASLDPDERFGTLLHVSLSHPDHLPSWEEVRLVKDIFFGELVDAMMVLPRKEEYVNKHAYCFHLWQTPEGWRRM